MILLINTCKEKLHYFEFVRPIRDILKGENAKFFVKNYKEVNNKDLDNAEKVIICGTSLKDNDFSLSENLKFFEWIRNFDKPILGICGGMQVIGRIFNALIRKEIEIGFFREKFEKSFLGIESGKEIEVYHLHNYYADFFRIRDFDCVCVAENKVTQAVKHKIKDIYGVLFHPEVRNKEIIKNFLKI